MKQYDNLRRVDVIPRQEIVNVMNQSLLSSFPAFALARTIGLGAVANIGPLRKLVMNQGLAPSADLPFAMRG